MRPIHKMVINLSLSEEQKQKIKNEAPEANVVYVPKENHQHMSTELMDADVAVIAGMPKLGDAKALQWIHCDIAGLDAVAKAENLQNGLMITGSAGRSAPALAEHVFFFMLNHVYQINRIMEDQKAHRFCGADYSSDPHYQALYQKTIGIVGMGNTGKELARKAKAFGMHVIGYDRSAMTDAYVDRMLSVQNGDSLQTLIQTSDYLVMSVALTDQTYHMLGKEQFKQMKPTAFVVNIGRGATIHEQAMIEALQEGTIAGAGLDTFEMEPLPADNSLWDMPNVLITPHVTPACSDKLDRTLDIILENIGHYHRGEPLKNCLKMEDLYHQR